VFDNLVEMLLGIERSKNVRHVSAGGFTKSILDLDKIEVPTIPFIFSTSHKRDQLRQLSLMHPKGQLLVIDFYDQYKDLLMYYCGLSSFSLRSPGERREWLPYFFVTIQHFCLRRWRGFASDRCHKCFKF